MLTLLPYLRLISSKQTVIGVGCNLKQFDVGRPKMHLSFSAVNENADENEIPFSAEKRKRKSPVLLLRFSCEHNIFGPKQMTFLERKRKIKQQ